MNTVDSYESIDLLIRRYRSFGECLLREARLTQFGTALELEFDYVWDDEDPAKRRLAVNPRTVILRLTGLHEARIVTSLPPSVLDAPELASWGLTEVAVVELLPHSELLANYRERHRTVHHLVAQWEKGVGRRIDVIFARLQVEER